MKWYEKQKADEIDNVQSEANATTLKSEGAFDNDEQTNEENRIATIMSKDVNLIGNLISKEDVRISGTIKGDIVCSKHLFIDGNVTGNLSSATLFIENAQINGDVVCSLDAKISQGTNIVGNIKAYNLVIGGNVVGNLSVKGELYLMRNAVINGNIEAASLESEKGVILKGLCSISDKI